MVSEKERIERVYQERARTVPPGWYTHFNRGNLFIIQQRERLLLCLLEKYGMNPLSDKRILDVGCGTGGELRNFVRYGAMPELLTGIDLLEGRIAQARKISPNIEFVTGSAADLPFRDGRFDIITQFTVFTSVLDRAIKERIAQEMLRVLSPRGIIVWYDFYRSNPRNQDVHGVGKSEVRELFAGCDFDIRKTTLAPPISRRLAPFSWLLCYVLEFAPFLRTHYLAVIKKRT
jgi:ubiquinone/menaquinone biosynthesis C-methylase UbiE